MSDIRVDTLERLDMTMVRCTRLLMALWAGFGLVLLALALAINPASDWAAILPGFLGLMLRLGLAVAVVWLLCLMAAWAWRGGRARV